MSQSTVMNTTQTKRNVFWKILFSILENNEPIPEQYSSKREFLKRHRIALWDVLSASRRNGSSDADIKRNTESPNDFGKFLADYKDIRIIFFNGQKAFRYFKSRVSPQLKNMRCPELIPLPSTSPANTSLTEKEKIEKWQIVRRSLLKMSEKDDCKNKSRK